MPRYSIPKTVYESPFTVSKERLMPNVGPGTYKSDEMINSGTGVVISPSKMNRSMLDVKRAREETNLAPGRYSVNISSFQQRKRSSIPTFGSASRAFNINEKIEVRKLSKPKFARARLSIERIHNDSGHSSFA